MKQLTLYTIFLKEVENKNNMGLEKTIYVSHVFKGLNENIEEVSDIMIKLHKKFPTYSFISPIHNYGMLYNCTDYVEGLNMCIKLLNMCDEMWVFGTELSTGVQAEIAYCKNNHIPYKIIGSFVEIPTRTVCHKNICDTDCLQCDFEDEDDAGISCWLKGKKLKGEVIF